MLRRKLKDLGLSDCVDKNILVQNWFRRVWSLQLVPPADVVRVFENHIKNTVPYEDDEEAISEDPDLVANFDENLSQFLAYLESNLVGTPRVNLPRKKPRIAINTWSVNESLLNGTEFSTNSSESWNSVSKLTVVAKPTIWQLIHQLQAEDATSRTKMLSIRTGSWKERHPGRVARREFKRKAMVNLVLDYYTMNTENFFDAAITFFNEC